MKLFTISTIASLASATVVDLAKRNTPINVRLEVVGNTAVKAWITNTGGTSLKLFKTGSLLDDSDVEKVKVFQKGTHLFTS
jgi:deuterolysin